ncbi:citrate synthase [Motilibacter rhizosphaerae]|uniref:Citrate synthase n=1 Tax=Motilibacter rhizosphaerae TaxID=598652 RepID=A0A4Q7NS59_9ACTN|nr:citrate synthase [Motilibacter rhizosphaerae]RZS87490.1 citrate synthase [Motilibacter rhizosphaerae]
MAAYFPGLEGVVGFETAICEPGPDDVDLRYRGLDVDELVGVVPWERVWSLLVDGRVGAPLPAVGAPLLPGGLQAGLAALAGAWGLRPVLDLSPDEVRTDLARVSAAALDLVARTARQGPAVPDAVVEGWSGAAERFLARWHGEVDPVAARALDAYWVVAAEHGLTTSTLVARVVASTGADVAAALSAAVGAMSGPLHGGAPERVLAMVQEVERSGDPAAWVRAALDRGQRLMGFGHRVYRGVDPRARTLRRVALELGAPLAEVAAALEDAALAELRERRPDRVLATNVDFWAAVLLDGAGVPGPLLPAVFSCGRTAGWSAHVLEQRRTGRLIRVGARYVGPGPRGPGHGGPGPDGGTG